MILKDLGIFPTEIGLTHDTDWTQFPDVGEALRKAGIAENCYAIGVCPSYFVWGIGVAASWKNREIAAKLAICLAVAPKQGS